MDFKQGEFKIGAHNWCEDEVSYKVEGNVLTFRLPHGDRFTLKHTSEEFEEGIIERVFLFYGESEDQECLHATKITWTVEDMVKYSDDQWLVASMDIDRSDADPVVAIVRMLAMTY